jgi:hypothetical protein
MNLVELYAKLRERGMPAHPQVLCECSMWYYTDTSKNTHVYSDHNRLLLSDAADLLAMHALRWANGIGYGLDGYERRVLLKSGVIHDGGSPVQTLQTIAKLAERLKK